MKGRNGSTSFLPSKKKGGLQKKLPSEQCLTKEQTKQIYDKVELGEEVKIKEIGSAEYFYLTKASDVCK